MKIWKYVIQNLPISEMEIPNKWVIATKYKFLIWDFIIWKLEDSK